MLKRIVSCSLLPAAVHFLVVVLYSRGIGGQTVADIFEIIGQPGLYASRELGFGGFGILDGIAGNKLGLWCVMAANSLLWGVMLGAIVLKSFRMIRK